MNLTKRLYINTILQSVIEDYNSKIKKLRLEEEFPAEYEEIKKDFKTRINLMLYSSKYDEVILKIKEYEAIKDLVH